MMTSDLRGTASAVVRLSRILVEALRELPDGMPEGQLYAVLMPSGTTLETMTRLLDLMTEAGLVTVRGHVVRAVRR